MEIKAAVLTAKVMHKRLMPKVNAFTYGMYYLVFPLSRMRDLSDGWRFGVNKPGILSFHEKDHGDRNGQDIQSWMRQILLDYGLDKADGEIVLIAMPRVLGYVFNPISMWLCLDKSGLLRAVLCEVNNTFGERHCYLCVHSDQRVIQETDIMQAEKIFHVSPFLHREGHYDFRFSLKENTFGAWINYFDSDGKKLLTALTGKLTPYSRQNMRRAFWRYPLVTYRAIFLIHWQALKLIFKGIRYIAKPGQLAKKLGITGSITKI